MEEKLAISETSVPAQVTGSMNGHSTSHSVDSRKRLIPIPDIIITDNHTPYKVHKALVENRIVPCINYVPYQHNQPMMTLVDLGIYFFPRVPLTTCRAIVDALGITLWQPNSAQLQVLRNSGKCKSAAAGENGLALVQIRDVMRHMRSLLDHSKRAANESYAQAASSRLCVAITCDRTGHLSKAVSDQVLAAVQKQIISEAWSPKQDGPGPTFNAEPVYAEGVLNLWCGNDHTLAWIRKTISSLVLPASVSLVVRSQSEIPRRARCAILIPDEQGMLEKPTNIGRSLAYQNPWLDIKRWVLLKAKKQTAAWFVVVGVPENQIPTLMKAGRRLSFGLGVVYVKFQGPNGRFADVPQGWDSTTSTIREELKGVLPMETERETTPQPNTAATSAAAPAEAEAAVTTAIASGAVPSSGEEPDDILSSASDLERDGFESGDLFAGLQLGGDEEDLTSDGVPFADL